MHEKILWMSILQPWLRLGMSSKTVCFPARCRDRKFYCMCLHRSLSSLYSNVISSFVLPCSLPIRPTGERDTSQRTMSTAQPGSADQGMNVAKEGWFTELSSMWPGQGLSLKIDEVLFKGKSDFQDVAVVKTEAFGMVLLLDGVIQCTDRDEFSYQEMITHLPACSVVDAPKKALVVGGGDGGVLRELSRHESLEEIHIAEIDGMVIDVAKKYFPQMAVGFSDPRVSVHVCDGIKFVQDSPENTYDIIVVDSSDPVGPAEVLFQKPFFEYMHRALKPGGVVCTQGESLWYHLDIIKSLAAMCREVFVGGTIQYAFTTIPTYPSGQIGFMVCSKAKEGAEPLDPREPRRPPPKSAGNKMSPLRYYNSDVHRAAFVLPTFAREALANSLSF